MQLNRLEFTLTTRCNSQCIHCQVYASPSRNEVMDVKDASRYLEEVATVSTLDSFMIFGGEPMLYPRLVVAILEKPTNCRYPR